LKERVQKKKNAHLAKLIALMEDGDSQIANFKQFLQDNSQAWKAEPVARKKYKNEYDILAAGDFHF
jgi:uncharacterized phage-associated protein